MKRPFMYAAISMLMASITWLLGYWFMPIILVIILFIYKKTQNLNNKKYQWLIVILFGLISIGYFMVVGYRFDHLKQGLQTEESIVGRGIIHSSSVKAYSNYYGLKPWWDSDGHRHNYQLLISTGDESRIGDLVSFEGKVLPYSQVYNEGSFDLDHYYRSSGVVGVVKGKVYIEAHTNKYALIRFMQNLREGHSEKMHQLLPNRHSAIMDDLLLGLNTVTEEDRRLFQKAGIVHILAISGLHVALIAGLLFKGIGFFSYNQKNTALFVATLTVAYCIYSGAHISTVRATIMVVVYLGHKVLYRKYDKHIALAFAFVLMMLSNPLQITSPGFILSFGAVMSIFYVVPKLMGLIKVEHRWLNPLSLLLGIQIGLTPVLAYYYHELPTYGVIGNLLIIPIITMVMLFGGLAIGFSYLSHPIALHLAGSVFWLTNYMLKTVEYISDLPFATIQLSSFQPYVLILYYVAVIAWILNHKRMVKWAVGMMVFVLLFLSLTKGDELVIDLLDVGNGDACFVRYHDYTLLIDGGGQIGQSSPNMGIEVLLPYMNYNGIHKIDSIFISHSDFDHIYGIIEIMDQVPIDQLFLSSVYEGYEEPMVEQLKALAEAEGVKLFYIQQGDRLQIDDLEVTCLYPLDSEIKDNNNRHSNILHLNLNDFDMLFTGDTYAEDEKLLMDDWTLVPNEVEVLKVAHHGSKTSSSLEFLEFINPRISLVSVGRNNLYGHPSEAVAQRLYALSNQVYMTKDYGQIKLKYKDGVIEIDTYIK